MSGGKFMKHCLNAIKMLPWLVREGGNIIVKTLREKWTTKISLLHHQERNMSYIMSFLHIQL